MQRHRTMRRMPRTRLHTLLNQSSTIKKTTARRTFLLRRAVVIWYRNALLCGSHFGQHLEGALHDGIAVGLTVGLGHVDPATL